MHIVLVEPDLVDNGALRMSLQRVRQWAAAGDDVTVFVVRGEGGGDRTGLVEPLGVDIHYGAPSRTRRALALPLALVRLVLLARSADVIVSGREIHYGMLLAALAARLIRRPFSVFVQSRVDLAIDAYVPVQERPLTLKALAGADQAVGVASGLLPLLTAIGLPAARFATVHNALDRCDVVAAAEADPQDDSVVACGSEPVVVGVGRLDWQKGFDLLIEAHALSLRQGALPHRLLLLGEGPERDTLEKLAADLGVTESVSLPGFVARPQPFMARASLVVSSSRWEGFPLVLLEALALGTPCIAFDCLTGPADVLSGGAFGMLVPPGDVPALAGAISEHLRCPDVLLTRAGRAQSKTELFDPGEQARRHRDLLLDLVVASKRRGRGL